MVAFVNFASERDPFSVRRPARLIVGFLVIGNLCQLPGSVRIDHPHICVAILFVFLTGAVRDESDAGAVRRPLGIVVVPIIAFGDLLWVATLDIDDPKVCAAIVEPTRVVEFIRSIFVMTHVTAIPGIAGATITWPNSANDNEARPIRRPAKETDSILQICNSLCFTAIHGKQINLVARLLGGR